MLVRERDDLSHTLASLTPRERSKRWHTLAYVNEAYACFVDTQGAKHTLAYVNEAYASFVDTQSAKHTLAYACLRQQNIR